MADVVVVERTTVRKIGFRMVDVMAVSMRIPYGRFCTV